MKKELREDHSKELIKKVESLKHEIEEWLLNVDTFIKKAFYTGSSNWSLLDVLVKYVEPDSKKISVLKLF